jgi:hypothetical protein
MAKKFKHGQSVEWDAAQGTIRGTVERIVTQTTHVKGHVAKATPEQPQVLVRSNKTGAAAIHRPEELRSAT